MICPLFLQAHRTSLAQAETSSQALRNENRYWMNYAMDMEKEGNNFRYAQDMAFFESVSLTSRLTRSSEKMHRPDSEGTYWKWYKTHCPCCRRPLEITMSSVKEEPWTQYPRGSRHAFVTALWGANAGYALGDAWCSCPRLSLAGAQSTY